MVLTEKIYSKGFSEREYNLEAFTPWNKQKCQELEFSINYWPKQMQIQTYNLMRTEK